MLRKFNEEIIKVKALTLNGEMVQGYFNSVSTNQFVNGREVNPYTVCQNTGIKDKNKVYVYAYDLVKLISRFSNDSYGYFEWDEQLQKWVIKTSLEFGGCRDYSSTFEVIGNIILNDDDLKKILQQDEKEKYKEHHIDNSDCRSTAHRNKEAKRFLC